MVVDHGQQPLGRQRAARRAGDPHVDGVAAAPRNVDRAERRRQRDARPHPDRRCRALDADEVDDRDGVVDDGRRGDGEPGTPGEVCKRFVRGAHLGERGARRGPERNEGRTERVREGLGVAHHEAGFGERAEDGVTGRLAQTAFARQVAEPQPDAGVGTQELEHADDPLRGVRSPARHRLG